MSYGNPIGWKINYIIAFNSISMWRFQRDFYGFDPFDNVAKGWEELFGLLSDLLEGGMWDLGLIES